MGIITVERPETGEVSANVQLLKKVELAKKTVFKTENFNLWYGDKHALKDINLVLKEKEVTAIIGPSGCGKST